MARKNTQFNSNRPRKYFNKSNGRRKKRIGFEELKNSYPFLTGGSSVYESFCTPKVDAYLLHDKKMESQLNDEFDEWYFENKGSHQRPFNLRRVEEYNRPKIFLRQSDVKFTATYVQEFVFGNYSLFNIYHSENRKEELKYLLAILNSKLLTFYGRQERHRK